MAQALIWLAAFFVIGAMLWTIINDGNRRSRRTVEEFERDVIDKRNSLLRAGMLEMDKFISDEKNKRAAVAYIQDEKEGMTRTGGKSDDADRTDGEK